MDLLVDHRWLLARQEEILRADLTVNDLSVLVGMAAEHRVNDASKLLIINIRALRLNAHEIADRLRSWRASA